MSPVDEAVRVFEELIVEDPLAFDASGQARCGCAVSAVAFVPCPAHREEITAMFNPEGIQP